ncbi:MAG: HAD-IC family P-type ATPase [bacterium]
MIKRTEATITDKNNSTFRIAKGAPQVILSLVPRKESLRKQVDKIIADFAIKGYRTLGVAMKRLNREWEYIGLLAMQDPPRDDSKETIQTAQAMGVKVKMITGDHKNIAQEIAREVGLSTKIDTSDLLIDKQDKEVQQLVENSDGFAEVFPEDKYRIVELLQRGNHIVGMTGDGVNDAPALKKADAGIAVAGATDAAKSAASLVITKPGISVIIDAIKESRKIFQRMNNYAIYRITETIRVLIFLTLSIIVYNFYPITSVMVILLALLNDIPIMAIAYDNVLYSNEPERWNMRTVLGMSIFLGLIGVVFSFTFFYIGERVLHLNREMIQPLIYLKLSVAGHLTLFFTRTKGHFWSIRPSWILFFAIIITQVMATFITVYGLFMPAIGWRLALLVWGFALTAFLFTDLIKVPFYKLLISSLSSTR